jgi:hypothetical protein
MKDLINAIIAYLQAAIDAEPSTLSAKIIYKGLSNIPEQTAPDVFPYIAIDDGGERTEQVTHDTQKRFYNVIIEFGINAYNVEANLDDLLDLWDEIKEQVELEANRQLEGHIWAINIIPIEVGGNNEKFYYKGRQTAIEFYELEDTYGEF